MEFAFKYPELEGQIAARGIKRNVIAERLGCSYKAFRNKCAGRTRFTWEEVQTLQSVFFPDISKEDLMRTNRQ